MKDSGMKSVDVGCSLCTWREGYIAKLLVDMEFVSWEV